MESNLQMLKEKWKVNGRVGAIVRKLHEVAEDCYDVCKNATPDITKDYEAHIVLMIIKHQLDSIVENFEGIIKEPKKEEENV